MSKIWDDYRKRIIDPNTQPEEKEALCAVLVEKAAMGDEEAERAVAALVSRFIGRLEIPNSLQHYVSVIFSFRAQGQNWERAARYRKYNILAATKKCSRWFDEREVIDAVKKARAKGYPLSSRPRKGGKTAFEVAAEILKDYWRDGHGRARGSAGTIPTPDNVREIWYRHHGRKQGIAWNASEAHPVRYSENRPA